VSIPTIFKDRRDRPDHPQITDGCPPKPYSPRARIALVRAIVDILRFKGEERAADIVSEEFGEGGL